MDNNNKTTKFSPQGHAPVVKKENNYSYTLFRTLSASGVKGATNLTHFFGHYHDKPTFTAHLADRQAFFIPFKNFIGSQ